MPTLNRISLLFALRNTGGLSWNERALNWIIWSDKKTRAPFICRRPCGLLLARFDDALDYAVIIIHYVFVLCFVLLAFRNGSGRRRPIEIKKSADHFHRGAASRPSGQFFTGLESRRPRLGTHRQFNGPVEKGDSGVVPEHESAAQETPQHFKQFRLQ